MLLFLCNVFNLAERVMAMKRFLKLVIGLACFICLAIMLMQTSFAAQSLTTTTDVNFRSGPSTDESVIRALGSGVSVAVLEHDPAAWSKV